MTASNNLTPVKALKIHCPVAPSTLAAMLAGDPGAADADPVLSALLTVIRDDNPLGDFGLYQSVIEISPGWESFTPGPDSQPTLGTRGINSLSPTAILTVYIPGDAPDDAVSAAIDRILSRHPWEVPVIELTETRIVRRLPGHRPAQPPPLPSPSH